MVGNKSAWYRFGATAHGGGKNELYPFEEDYFYLKNYIIRKGIVMFSHPPLKTAL